MLSWFEHFKTTHDTVHRILASGGHGKSVGSIHPDAKMIGGIVVGYILFMAFLIIITIFHFFYPWGIELKKRVPPETYLYAGIHTLGAMIVTGGILTRFWSEIPSPSPLEEWYGYNNICIVFDLVPSKYIMPSYWFACGYFITRYAVEDSRRIFRMKELYSTARLYFFLLVNAAVILICAFFALCLAVGPDEDMIAHTTPFLCLIIALPLMYLSHWLRAHQPTSLHTAAVAFYGVVSYVKASLTITALVATHVPGKYALFIDYLWMGGAVVAPFLFCPIYNDIEDLSTDATEAKRRAFHASSSAAPLILPLTLVIFGNLAFNIIAGAFKRIYAIIFGPVPHTRASKSKCPMEGAYVGDIFGYFSFMFGGCKVLHHAKQKRGCVFATNLGEPVVCLFDERSVNAMLENQNPSTTKFYAGTVKAVDDDKNFNFYRSGQLAISVRQLLMRLIPISEDDEHFQKAMKALSDEMRLWTEGNILHDLDVFEAVHRLIIVFTSVLITGDRIDPDLAKDASPVPLLMPNYPQFPKRLLPLYYGLQSSWGSMAAMVKESTRWSEIQKIAVEVGLSEEEAVNNVLIAITLNALGLSNSMVNALYLLNINSEWNQELVEDNDMLESFAWELLRHNGPPLARKVDNVTTIAAPTGELEVKEGTILYSKLPLVMRDERLWKEPDTFKAERFLKQKDGSYEPKPILGMGCPLQHFHNGEVLKNSHTCLFLNLVVPFLKSYVRVLVNDFHFRLDSKTRKRLEKILHPHFTTVEDGNGKPKKTLHADFSIENLCGSSDLSKDMTPDLGMFHTVSFALLEVKAKGRNLEL